MGGWIELKSILNQGTTFTVNIPIQVAPQRQDSASILQLKKRLNILLVKQKPSKWFGQLLENLHCSVSSAVTFNEALFYFKENVQTNLDLVLIDNHFRRIETLNCINAMREIEGMYKIKKKTFIYILTKDKQESLECYSISDQHDGIFPKNANVEEVSSFLQSMVFQKAKYEINKVLIVDDEQSNVFNLSQMLESLYIPYITADNGQEAVQKYCENMSEIGMIIIDNEMPLKNGPEAIKEIRDLRAAAQTNLRKCIIIMLSGDDQITLRQKAFEAGADDFKVKPLFKIQLEELMLL